MEVDELFSTFISTGVIAQSEVGSITKNQLSFSRCEKATAFNLGQLIDSGQLLLGCRL